MLATLKFEYKLSLCYVVKFQLFLGAAFIHNTNRRAQKCWDLSGNISKTSNLSPSALNKVEFLAPWVEMSPFLTKHCWGGGVGGWRDEPKANQKIVIRSRVLRNNITWKGFFTQSRVLLVSIVWNWFRVIKWTFCHLSIQRDGKTFALELSKCSTVVFSKIFFEHSWWSVCHTKELWTRCQECSPLTFSQWQKELKVIIWVQHLFYCVFLRHLMLIVLAFLLSENVHLEDSNGISLRQARKWPFLNLFSFLNIVIALTFYGE